MPWRLFLKSYYIPLSCWLLRFYVNFCCNYKHNNGGKLYNHESCTTMCFVGKITKLLETQKFHFHNLLTYLLPRYVQTQTNLNNWNAFFVITLPQLHVKKASYHTRWQMGLLHFENILKVFINRYGMNGLNKRKMGFKKKKPTKKVWLHPFNHFLIFLMKCFNLKMIITKKSLNKIWHCF